MKLKRINRIQRFGVFENFSWQGDLPDFNLFNAFYGWNYSGKTTLSRIFRCFELGKLHEDYSGSNFTFQDFDGNSHTSNTFPSTLSIRVFNSDFIGENLKWNEGIEPILLLGQENIELQTQLDQHKSNLSSLRHEIALLENEKRDKDQAFSNALTTKARELKNEYSIPGFDKRQFEPLVNEACNQSNGKPLSQEEILELRGTYFSTEKKNPINEINVNLPEPTKLLEEVNTALQQTVKSEVIEKLKNNPPLNAWVKQGKHLHENKINCEFCGSLIATDLLEKLSNHFSDDYENLINGLTDKIQQLERKKISITLPDPAKFYAVLQQAYSEKKTALEEEISKLNQTISILINSLEDKKKEVFIPLPQIDITNNFPTILTLVDDINSLIKAHNTKTSEFEQQRQDAYEKLIANSALEFVVNQNYQQTVFETTALTKNITTKKQLVPGYQIAIRTIEQQLSETVKGAEITNDYLKRYFGKGDIQIAVTQDNKFQLLRDNIIAKNLSEGEKTAIAFAYFMTRLKDKNTNFSTTLVYIDDPISSLDSNHLFNTYSFIKDHFYEPNPTAKQHKCKCAQFFISTHNYEFFNLIKDWFGKMKKHDTSYYLIARTSNTTTNSSTIRPLHNHLLKYKSEYSYLFSVIHDFKQNPTASFDQLYNLPNILRRFIESFTAFKYLSTRNIEENIDQFITNPVDCERVRKFVHYHSHSLTTTKLEQFSDLTESVGVVEIVVTSLAVIDPLHYASLIAENTPLPPIDHQSN